MQMPDATGAAASTIAETLAKLGADPTTGLSDAEVQQRSRSFVEKIFFPTTASSVGAWIRGSAMKPGKG